jgi:uracil-DNA glycosylase family 4
MSSTKPLTREYLEEVWSIARKTLPGWVYATIRNEARARAGGKVKAKNRKPLKLPEKRDHALKTIGPKNAPIAFIGASPSAVDVARREPFIGPAGLVLKDQYLKPLKLKRDKVVLGNVVPVLVEKDGHPVEPTQEQVQDVRDVIIHDIEALSPRVVVALGKTAANALGERCDFVLPHPNAILKMGDSGEVSRKLKRIKRAMRTKVEKQGEEGSEDTRGAEAQKAWEKSWHEYMPKSGSGRMVYQHHFRGLDEEETKLDHAALHKTDNQLHGDLRFDGEGGLWGFSVFLGTPKDNAADNDKLIKLDGEKKARLAPKMLHPKEWLSVGVGKPQLIRPGGPGSTRNTWSKFFAVDGGKYQLGVARESAVEIFLDGRHLKGRYILQLADLGDGRRAWLIDKPKEQTPIAERSDLADVISELKRKQQRYLIWGKPGDKPKLIDVQAAEVEKDREVQITKADPMKKIVYGVVLDPYGARGPQEDAHRDWMPPSEIEKTAHKFMTGSRVVGVQHKGKSGAKVVESWVEQYPSKKDYRAAMENQPHKVLRREFGDDVVHSGSWLLGVQLGDEEWKLFQDGKVTAFSPRGRGIRNPMDKSQMPDVSFVDVAYKPASK